MQACGTTLQFAPVNLDTDSLIRVVLWYPQLLASARRLSATLIGCDPFELLSMNKGLIPYYQT
jgi:hypothetical protein